MSFNTNIFDSYTNQQVPIYYTANPSTVGGYMNTPTQTLPTMGNVPTIAPSTSTTGSMSTTGASNTAKPTTGLQLAKNWGELSFGDKANTVMGTVGTLFNAYNAFKAHKLAKEQFNHAKQVYVNNWDAQRKQTNSQLEDRQKRRVEEAQANGRTTTSVSDYMKKYGI